MSKIPKKHSVYMACRKSEAGFTFISMLLVISLIAFSLPFIAYLTKSASYASNNDELSIQQFFKFLRDDVINSQDYQVNSNILYLTLNDKETATIGTYNEAQVRRQVNGKGHELYLRNIKELKFEEVDYGIRTTVISNQGVKYEKTIIFY